MRQLLLPLLFTIACSPVQQPAQTMAAASDGSQPAASIVGTIASIHGDRVLIDDKANVRVTERTEIARRDGGRATLADLRAGQRVSVWYGDVVMKSYPIQTDAVRIVIEP